MNTIFVPWCRSAKMLFNRPANHGPSSRKFELPLRALTENDAHTLWDWEWATKHGVTCSSLSSQTPALGPVCSIQTKPVAQH